MRLPSNESSPIQLELLDEGEPGWTDQHRLLKFSSAPMAVRSKRAKFAQESDRATATQVRPLLVPVTCLYESANNPRTEFPEPEIVELTADIALHGVLQPIVVHPADADGRYRVHFGAKRLRAARRAGLSEVPVMVRDAPSNAYAQVAENQKRHGLSQLDIARFIRSRVDAGDSNATIAKELGMNLTTVAHHLSLIELPIELDQALQCGRCTSPRTLHELRKLHDDQPEQVRALIAGRAPITRAALSAVRAKSKAVERAKAVTPLDGLTRRAHVACEHLERTLDRIPPPDSSETATADLIALRQRVIVLADRWLQRSDRQTPQI